MGDVIKSVLKGGVVNTREEMYKYLMSEECIITLKDELNNRDVIDVIVSAIFTDISSCTMENYGEDALLKIDNRLFKNNCSMNSIVQEAILPIVNIRLLMVIKFVASDYLRNYLNLKHLPDFGSCLSKFRYILESESITTKELLNDLDSFYKLLVQLLVDTLYNAEIVGAGVRGRVDVLDSLLMGKIVEDNDTIRDVVQGVLSKHTLSEEFIKLYREAATLQLGEGCFVVLNNRCVKCGDTQNVTINKTSYVKWALEGVFIQEAMSELTPAEREMFLSGICGKCW